MKTETITVRPPVDTRELPRTHPEPWFAQTLASHGGANLKFRVMRGTVADFHVHTSGPECFFVLTGTVTIDLDSESVTLNPGQFFEVPAGVRHRSRVEGEATLLVFDGLAP
ncbi:cupin domain-containing protein [Ramlibacter sp. XY19]|uniref:cupin domain-containing protein n=1 Tax=Ramlibacter paludis TaxID=2908000 RepID=UPI0023DBCB03|nr:cupin domain-containing protein [Ramlibacter paludis]MCG2594335.1 cupin domain-containing protein [Ramlibacter paludis]